MTTLLALAAVCLQSGPPPFEPPALVPPVLRAEPRFAPFAVPEDARVVAASESLLEAAEAFAEDFEAATGLALAVVQGSAKSGDIILSIGGTVVSTLGTDEASAVEVYGDHVALMGAGTRGVARAAARALQLVEVSDDGGVAFPPLLVVDAPGAEWRGLAVDVTETGTEEEAQRALVLAFDAAHRHGWNRVVVRGPWTEEGDASALGLADQWLGSTEAAARARGRGVAIAIALSAAGPPPPAPDGGEGASTVTEVLLDARGVAPERTLAWIAALDARGLAVVASLDAEGARAAADALPERALLLVGGPGGASAGDAAALDRRVVNAGALQLLGSGGASPTLEGWRLGALGGAAMVRGDALDAGVSVAGSLVPFPGRYPDPARARLLRTLATPAWTAGPWLTPSAAEADAEQDR